MSRFLEYIYIYMRYDYTVYVYINYVFFCTGLHPWVPGNKVNAPPRVKACWPSQTALPVWDSWHGAGSAQPWDIRGHPRTLRFLCWIHLNPKVSHIPCHNVRLKRQGRKKKTGYGSDHWWLHVTAICRASRELPGYRQPSRSWSQGRRCVSPRNSFD